jgi:hypothetical protein
LPGLGSTLANGLSGRAALARSIAARYGGQTAEDLMEESVIARMRPTMWACRVSMEHKQCQ